MTVCSFSFVAAEEMGMRPPGSIFFFYCQAGGLGQTSEPGEDVVAVGSIAYGSATGSFQWYSWFAVTGLARWHTEADRQTRKFTV